MSTRTAPIELDALLTSVQELGRLAEVDTPHIDAVLALAQQMGRVAGIYPTFPEETASSQDETSRFGELNGGSRVAYG